MAIDLKGLLKERIDEAADCWVRDLLGHREDQLTNRPSTTTRPMADVAWETIVVNRALAARLRGDESGALGVGGFPPCPPEMANRSNLAKQMRDSADEVLSAAGDDLERDVPLASGGTESAFAYAEFAALHMQYHLGQINYLQTLYGDVEQRWD